MIDWAGAFAFCSAFHSVTRAHTQTQKQERERSQGVNEFILIIDPNGST